MARSYPASALENRRRSPVDPRLADESPDIDFMNAPRYIVPGSERLLSSVFWKVSYMAMKASERWSRADS
jgi:hypothetical protein